jgi:hypothetical protein
VDTNPLTAIIDQIAYPVWEALVTLIAAVAGSPLARMIWLLAVVLAILVIVLRAAARDGRSPR